MRIAIVGGGIAGLTAAYLLHPEHAIVLFEAHSKVGGHTNTVDVRHRGKDIAIDTGFIVFNDRTYPNFIRLLEQLGVASQATSMSFSVSCERSGWEYRGSDFRGLFAQPMNLLRPPYWRFLADLMKFHRLGPSYLAEVDEHVSVGEFLSATGYSRQFCERFFLPMGSAIWSCPRSSFAEFPIRFVLEFYEHHGLLRIRDRPQWRVVSGGSRVYVDRMTRDFANSIRVSSPVTSVRRGEDHVEVVCRGETVGCFDHVIFACHSDQALRILGAGATSAEREVLGAMPYEDNEAILHTDTSILPRNRRAWASWNYRVHGELDRKASVTYNMNLLQGIQATSTFCVTLNDRGQVRSDSVLARFTYAHPLYSRERTRAAARHGEISHQNRTSYCGAYWGNGFHEDGVVSAQRVCAPLIGSGVAMPHHRDGSERSRIELIR